MEATTKPLIPKLKTRNPQVSYFSTPELELEEPKALDEVNQYLKSLPDDKMVATTVCNSPSRFRKTPKIRLMKEAYFGSRNKSMNTLNNNIQIYNAYKQNPPRLPKRVATKKMLI